jgi:hypothetical protein
MTIIESSSITCAKPSCDRLVALADSVYVDGCGQVCSECDGSDAEWLSDIEPPF